MKRAAEQAYGPVETPPPPHQLQIVQGDDGLVLRGALACAASWRDPDHLDPLARAPRIIEGLRRPDALRRLYTRGSISERQFFAADRFHQGWAIGIDGARPGQGRDLSEPRTDPGRPSGHPPVARLNAVRS